ncbi:hypothetical protein [Streptomyces filamentosus]|uniref:hypothetical protein n=1 Tax=Streptomyces filamentosus TaxID=67294 RepID=UPI001239326C|nr:hypothetical protein [Streptomyces filamentosus]KAA6220016.1 hypothetical protein CP979_26320 [Streptomyces filamentosus]
MRITPIAATASLLLALTACGTADNPPASPSDKQGAEASTATTTPADTAADRQACIEAIADVIDQRPDDFNAENDSDPKPEECAAIADDDYLDAYMDGLQLRNERAINGL